MNSEMTSTEIKALRPKRSEPLSSLAMKFNAAAHSNGIWVGVEESEYIAKVFQEYAELVDRLNGEWIKHEQS